ncbi:hypothetical protein EPN52_05505 [bacterium]|nr:MAG: hypothetical protein EPN52_05505 [bacterium]
MLPLLQRVMLAAQLPKTKGEAMRTVRVILVTAVILAQSASLCLAADPPPFAVLQIATQNGLRSATVQIAPGFRGIITIVPGAKFGSVTVTRIDDDGVWLSDGQKVSVDQNLAYPYLHRYDGLLRSDQPDGSGSSS